MPVLDESGGSSFSCCWLTSPHRFDSESSFDSFDDLFTLALGLVLGGGGGDDTCLAVRVERRRSCEVRGFFASGASLSSGSGFRILVLSLGSA